MGWRESDLVVSDSIPKVPNCAVEEYVLKCVIVGGWLVVVVEWMLIFIC